MNDYKGHFIFIVFVPCYELKKDLAYVIHPDYISVKNLFFLMKMLKSNVEFTWTKVQAFNRARGMRALSTSNSKPRHINWGYVFWLALCSGRLYPKKYILYPFLSHRITAGWTLDRIRIGKTQSKTNYMLLFSLEPETFRLAA